MSNIEHGKPFTLPDGTIVSPNGEDGAHVETAAEVQARNELDAIMRAPMNNEYTELYKRTLADVNVEPKRMHAVTLVTAYTLWGLDEYAIGQLMDVPAAQVTAIKESELYSKLMQELIEGVRYAETASVHGYLAENARKAAAVVVANLSGNDRDRALSAARDILDRTGYRPVDRVEHVHKFEDELRIVHVRDDNAGDVEIDFRKGIDYGDSA